MKTYHLKILVNSTSDHYDCSKQFIKETVEAENVLVQGDGRVYHFIDGAYETIAYYPTSNTIIEKITG